MARKPRTKKAAGTAKPAKKTASSSGKSQAKYPRHSIEKALRIPRAIMEQNAGKICTDREAAQFSGVGFNGPFAVEIASSVKYGFLARPQSGHVEVTERARRILRPQSPEDVTTALREGVLAAPEISSVYSHYRGENLPDGEFFENALTDKFGIPNDKVKEFTEIFLASIEFAKLVERRDDKVRILDVSDSPSGEAAASQSLKKLGQGLKVSATDTCFVMMPFALPIGGYYKEIYVPAIERAGLRPVRADADIFGTGKIIDQIWHGINNAKVLVAELTERNANVFYELGLAHALQKPVVLVSSSENDVPFDLQHIRVIYYDMTDPFWGQKLVEKVAENILSAIKNPDEAIFQRALEKAN